MEAVVSIRRIHEFLCRDELTFTERVVKPTLDDATPDMAIDVRDAIFHHQPSDREIDPEGGDEV